MVEEVGARNENMFPLSPYRVRMLQRIRMSITSNVAFCRNTVMIAYSLADALKAYHDVGYNERIYERRCEICCQKLQIEKILRWICQIVI